MYELIGHLICLIRVLFIDNIYEHDTNNTFDTFDTFSKLE